MDRRAARFRRMNLFPEFREVGRQRQDPAPALLVQYGAIGLALSLILLLGLGQRTQPLVPIRFQGVGHQAILGIDLHEPLPGQVGLVAGTLDVLSPQAIRLVQPLLQLVLDRQGDLQGQGREHLQEQACRSPRRCPDPGCFGRSVRRARCPLFGKCNWEPTRPSAGDSGPSSAAHRCHTTPILAAAPALLPAGPGADHGHAPGHFPAGPAGCAGTGPR